MKLRLTQFPFFKGYVGNSRKLPDFSHHKKNKLNYLKSNSSMQMMNVNKCLKKVSLFISLKKKEYSDDIHVWYIYIYRHVTTLHIVRHMRRPYCSILYPYICVCVLARACWLFYSMMQITMGLRDPTMWCEVHVPRCHLEEEKKNTSWFEEVKSFHNEFKSSFLKLG